MQKGNYVNELGVFKAAVVRCFEREPKGKSKAAVYMEFERISDKAIVSMRFSSPMTDSDYFRISRVVLELQGKMIKTDELKKVGQKKVIEALDRMKGEVVNVYVRPREWTAQDGYKGTIWGVEDVVHGKYSVGHRNDSNPAGDEAPGEAEDLPF